MALTRGQWMANIAAAAKNARENADANDLLLADAVLEALGMKSFCRFNLLAESAAMAEAHRMRYLDGVSAPPPPDEEVPR